VTVVDTFRTIAESLAFNPSEVDQFNKDIQAEIEMAAPELALAFACIKLDVNKRLYWASR